jgi:hypothetical protein
VLSLRGNEEKKKMGPKTKKNKKKNNMNDMNDMNHYSAEFGSSNKLVISRLI